MTRNDLVINLLRYLHSHGEPAIIAFENGDPVVVLPAVRRHRTGSITGGRWVGMNADGSATLEIQL